MARAEPNLIKEGGRGRFGRGVELCVQDALADVIVAQCRRSLWGSWRTVTEQFGVCSVEIRMKRRKLGRCSIEGGTFACTHEQIGERARLRPLGDAKCLPSIGVRRMVELETQQVLIDCDLILKEGDAQRLGCQRSTKSLDQVDRRKQQLARFGNPALAQP